MNRNIFYHFLSPEDAIYDLKHKKIRVSVLDTLNDPFEFMPYRRYRFEERQPYNRVFRNISKKWGLLCFSQVWKEQLLWAYYARKHTGIALGFQLPESEIIKVSYSTSEIRNKFDLGDDQKENEKLFLKLASKKFQEWKYEKEYRLLVQLNDCEIVKGRGYFISFGNNIKIKEIILGCRFDHHKNRGEILDLARQNKAEVIATRPGWEDYRIHRCGTRTAQYHR
jgi:hypothetical protein